MQLSTAYDGAAVAPEKVGTGAPFGGTPRFEIVRALGEGGMGIVYEAFDRERNGRVALKRLHTLTAHNLLRFKNEFRALHDLDHPNLVSLDQLFEGDGQWFFTMELVPGVDFLTWVRPEGWHPDDPTRRFARQGGPSMGAEHGEPSPPSARLNEERLRAALVQLADGLCALHAAGKVHRDIKPSNVLVNAEGRVVILDFGLVSDADGRADQAGLIAGTLAFMAPEQAASEAIGPEADWYAVGVMLYLALTGRLPFDGPPTAVLEAKQGPPPIPPRQLVPEVPADLDALCMKLLTRDPADRANGAWLLRHLGAAAGQERPMPTQAPFVGRRHELAELRAGWQRAVDGRATAIFVTGESGVGKSALVRRFLEEIDPAAAYVLTARCYEREAAPYKAFDEVMARLSEQLAQLPTGQLRPLLPERIGQVAAVFPALRRASAIAKAFDTDSAPVSVDAWQSRAHVLTAVRDLLRRLRCNKPMLMAIDDLQWADPDSITLLSYLMSSPDAPAILFCATMRVPMRAELVELCARIGDEARGIPVGRLAHDDARALARWLLSSTGERGQAARAEQLATLAGGHPMFLDALVRHGDFSSSGTGPHRLDDAIWARVTAQEPAAACVLELVCAAGQPIPLEVCARAAELPFAEIVRVARRLTAANLARTDGVGRRDRVEPYHDRVREAVVARLVPYERRARHARLAWALRESGEADPEALAFHYEAAGDPGLAARYARRAAARAARALAFGQAAQLYRRALTLDPGPPARAQRLRLELADALANGGRGAEAAELYLALADAVPDELHIELLRRAAEQLLASGRIDAGLAAIRSVLDPAGIALPTTAAGSLAALAVNRARIALRGLPFRYRLREPGSASPSLLARADACWSVSVGLAVVDSLRSADFQSRHLLYAAETGDPRRLASALGAEAMFAAARGRDVYAKRVAAEAERLAESADDWNARGHAAFAHSSIAYFAGHWREARERCDKAETILRDRCTGVDWFLQTVRHGALESLWYAGEARELCRRVPGLLADAQARGDLYAGANLRIGIPNAAWLVRDDVDTARRHAAEALAFWSREAFHVQHLGHLLAEVQTDLYAGDGAAAHAKIRAAWPRIRRAHVLVMPLSRIISYHQRGRAALGAAAVAAPGASGRRRFVADARRAARAIAATRCRWAEPMAALLRAGACALDGNDGRAAHELTAAIAGFDAVGMKLYGAAARLRIGNLQQGDAGREHVDAARVQLEGQGVRRMDRLAAVLAPGF